MTMPMKRVGALGAAFAMAAALAGCSVGGGAGSNDDTLTWWTTQQTSSIDTSQAAWEAVAERYTEESGIEVEVEVIPWADLYNKILAAVSSGTAPDMINIGTTWTSSLQDTGAFLPVTGENLEALGGSERFVESAWTAARVPETDQVAIPVVSNVYALFYNPKMFETAGITEPPATWEEFVAAGKKLTLDKDGDGEIDQWGFTSPGAALTQNSHHSFALGQQEGGSFVDDEGNSTLSSPEQAAGIQRYVDLMATHKIWSPADAEVDAIADATDQFINGEAAMMFHQNPLTQFESRDFTDWKIAEFPVPEGGENVQSIVGGTNILVFEESGNAQAAFELAGHVTSPEEQAFLADTFTMLPVVTEAYDVKPFAGNGDPTVEVREEILANASAPFPLVPNVAEIELAVGDGVREMLQAYATGEDPDVEGRLSAVDEQINQ